MSRLSSTIRHLPVAGDCLELVQLTDTHLCRTAGGNLLGMDTDHSLQAVIDLVRRERPSLDAVLGTGDLSDQGAGESYQRLLDYFDGLNAHHYWLPGNHDDLAMMQQIGGNDRLSGEVRGGGWQILMLDSQIPGAVGGKLGSKQLTTLARTLDAGAAEGLHALVCLHHQPVEIGCDWLDKQMVADAGDFFAVLDQYPRVRGVLWGHVHQEIDQLRNDVLLMATPSTCVQFAPGQEHFKVDDKAPGYRWLSLHPDGRIETAVSRVTGVKFSVDLESGGYL
jgi:3',5'-cyclic-AMP phosphodiesterase